jgi:hypothetical protein
MKIPKFLGRLRPLAREAGQFQPQKTIRPTRRNPFLRALGIGLCLAGALTSQAFSLYDHQMNPDSSPLGTVSLIDANPNDYWSWIPIDTSPSNIVITYKFDQNFINFFSSAPTTVYGSGLDQIEDQVRMALNRWSISSYSLYGGDPSDNLYGTSTDLQYGIGSYARMNVANNMPQYGVPNNWTTATMYEDIRTATLHELGHVVGLAHPSINNTAANFRIYPYTSQIPGILMNGIAYGPGGPGNPTANTLAGSQTPTGGEVMSPLEGPGWINHIPSWDDLDGYNIAYSQTVLTFVEVYSNTPAQITFTTYGDPDPTHVSQGIPYGTPQDANPLDGVLITNGIVEYNTNCMWPIGFERHGINWNITAGRKFDTIDFQIHGSDNLNCGIVTYNGPFATATESPNSDPVDFKDDTEWTWTSPTPNPIQPTQMAHVGFSLDVWDWTIVTADVSLGGGAPTVLPAMAISFEDFYPGAPGLETALLERPNRNEQPSALALTTIPSNTALYGPGGTNAVSHGISLVNSTAAGSPVTISDLQIADVTTMGLTFSNLTTALLNQLTTNGSMNVVSNFGSHTLLPGQQFVVVMQGSVGNLPTNILASGDYLAYNRPDLLGKEVFAYWKSTANGALVENFAIAGEPPIVSKPTPSLRINLQPGGTNGLLSWPYPSIGYVLEKSASLVSSNWTAIPTQPTVVSNFNQQAVPIGPSKQFFRLKNNVVSQ